MLSYRANINPDNPMSAWGHAMFADNPSGIEVYGDCWWVVNSNDLTDITDLREAILAARHEFDPDTAYYMTSVMLADFEYLNERSDDEFFGFFNPDDIVDSADAYDSDTLCAWAWESVFEPLGVRGVKTQDGAVVYDPDIIKRCDNPNDSGYWDYRRGRWVTYAA